MLAQLAGYYSSDAPFITRWQTTGASESITIPLVNGTTYNFVVDWGDGTAAESVVGSSLTGKSHTYTSAGTYDVSIRGAFPRIFFNNGGDRTKIKQIVQWGSIVWSSMASAFRGCTALTIPATDLPNLSAVTDISFAWRDCTSLTSFPLLNTSSVVNFAHAWRGCSGLTSFPVLNTAAGTDLLATWFGCSGLTSFPVLNTAACTNFSYSWSNCSGLTSFPVLNTAAGTNFEHAWSSCASLTSFPLLNMSAGTNFNQTWLFCSNLKTLATGLGLNCGAGTNFTSTLSGVSLTTASYNQFLVELEAANQNNSVPFHGGNSKHSGAGTTARTALITDHSWTITDGGAA